MKRILPLLFVLGMASMGTLLLSAASGTNPLPLINQPLVPAAIAPGGPAITLTVNGTGFVSGSVVNWNGSARATKFVSGSLLTASILASDVAKPGTSSVTVVNPTPGGGTSNVAFFEVAPPSPAIGFILSGFGDGSQGWSVATADFNRDGKLDVAVASPASNTVIVSMGNGDGTFQAPVDYPTGTQPPLATQFYEPSSVVVGDFNGDGKPDLAVSNLNESDISILLGNGDGTFQKAVNYATGSSPAGIAVGDFNQDGKLDLAVADSGESEISVLLGNGDGTFRAPVNYVAGSAPVAIAIGDFNRDGKLDLAVANFGCGTHCGNISILLGNGDGTFQSPVNHITGAQPTSLATGDLNGDGNLDLVVANGSSGSVSVLVGNGDGTFQAPVNYGVPCCSDPLSVTVADINGDGKLDLVVAGNVGCGSSGCLAQGNFPPGIGGVGVLLGNGDGTFQVPARYFAGQDPEALVIGDFNGDGRLDVFAATAYNANNAFNLLLNAGNSSFTLSLTQAGSGTGSVTSNPPGINCTTSCSGSFPEGTIVTLTAMPAIGSSFLGWSGACTGVSACSVDMTADQAFTATFGTSPISVSISPSPASVVAGGSVVFTATVNNDPNNLGVSWRLPLCKLFQPCVGGTLTATSSTSTMYTAPANAAGKQTTITATSNEDPSKGAQAIINISTKTSSPDFSLSPASASLTAQRGGQVTDMITIAPQNGSFGSAVQLSCAVTGSTPAATCALSPSSVVPGANSATSTLTINIPGLSAQLPPHSQRQFPSALYAVFVTFPGLAVVGFGLAFDKKRKQRCELWFLCVLFIGFVAVQAGCAGGPSVQQQAVGQPLNYTVTLTAASGTIQHVIQVQVTVP